MQPRATVPGDGHPHAYTAGAHCQSDVRLALWTVRHHEYAIDIHYSDEAALDGNIVEVDDAAAMVERIQAALDQRGY
jgi:hypothetical protein